MGFWDTIGKYTASKYMRFGEGEMWFGKQRAAFNFMPIMAKDFIINNGPSDGRYAATLFLSAKRTGYEDARQHSVPLVKSWTPGVRIGIEWLDMFGLGVFRSVRADNKEGFMVIVGRAEFGLEMKSEGQITEPVDFVIAGLIAGFVEYYVKTPIYVVETSCIAQKNVDECIFVGGHRKDIVDYVKKFSPDKLETAGRTLDTIEAVEKELKAGPERGWLV